MNWNYIPIISATRGELSTSDAKAILRDEVFEFVSRPKVFNNPIFLCLIMVFSSSDSISHYFPGSLWEKRNAFENIFPACSQTVSACTSTYILMDKLLNCPEIVIQNCWWSWCCNIAHLTTHLGELQIVLDDIRIYKLFLYFRLWFNKVFHKSYCDLVTMKSWGWGKLLLFAP